MNQKKVIVTIAGSDSSGGAGIQADLKTFEAFGLFGTSVITVLTAQNTQGVSAIEPLSPAFVLQQLDAIFDDFDVAAVKIGMLFDTPIIKAVEQFIQTLDIPIVVDPVFISKAGSPLLKEEAITALKSLCKHATVITPNKYEAKALFGYKVDDETTFQEVFDFPVPVLIKNHTLMLDDEEQSIDELFFIEIQMHFTSPKAHTNNLHGTGCSYSSAIAANLALGHSLEESITIAKIFIYQALIQAPILGHGSGPIGHKAGGEYLNTQS